MGYLLWKEKMSTEELEQQMRMLAALAASIVCASSQPALAKEDECGHCIKLGISKTEMVCVVCRKRIMGNHVAGVTITEPDPTQWLVDAPIKGRLMDDTD